MGRRTWLIRFTSGRDERIEGYRCVADTTLLKIRTTHSGAYNEQWVTYPLANIESYREEP